MLDVEVELLLRREFKIPRFPRAGVWVGGGWPEPLTRGEKFALISEFRKLMRIARIYRPDALYGASISAHIVEASGQVVVNPIDFEEAVGVNISHSDGDIKFAHIERCDAFLRRNRKMRTDTVR